MKVAVYAILLYVICTRCASGQNLEQCRDSCAAKIPDIQLCNETCVELLNASSVSNVTTLPPTPDPPQLLSSTYFTFTLQWNDYSQTKYNASPFVYVLEVKRHENTSDPAIILPLIKKYHTTKNTTFTIPEQYVTKTNFSFRLAVVTTQGTSNFSLQSPLYITNSTCDRAEHYDAPGKFYPCPLFNVRLNFTATEVLYQTPRIFSTVSWDYPHDIHINLERNSLAIIIERAPDQPRQCLEFGVDYHPDYPEPQPPDTRGSVALPSESRPFYFGCSYVIQLFSDKTDDYEKFLTQATFEVPHCIHGFCGCDHRDIDAPKKDSKHIDVDVRGSNHSVNKTTVNVTWRIEAWNKKPEFFKLIIQECRKGICPALSGFRRYNLRADPVKTSYSFIFPNLTEGEEHHVIIAAFDRSACLLTPTEGQHFYAVVPTIPVPSTTSPSIKTSTVAVPTTTIPSTKETTVVSAAVNEGLSSATVAAITVPIVLLLVAGLVLVLLFYYRLHPRKSPGLHRAPTGLQRLADHMHRDDNYFGNRQNDFSSLYSSDYDRTELEVNLPSKTEGGLELNPAYVEQRIQEALETGEADEFEFGYHRLELKRVLGKGAFGKVFLAEAYGIGGSEETSLVAVKVLNEKANEDEVEDFKIEINFMKTIGRHENVVTMLGCCTLYPPLCLVVEYVPHGDLLHYLRNLRKTFEMQNRKLQGEDIEKLKNEQKTTSSTTAEISSGESVMGPGSYSRRPLVPSASGTAISELALDADEKPPKAQKSRLLRQCKSEGKHMSITNAIVRITYLTFYINPF